jgi:hypothetical protein
LQLPPRASELRLLHQWLDSCQTVGLIRSASSARQGDVVREA